MIYATTMTRPDIAFAVGQAAKVMARPTREDHTHVKRILRYHVRHAESRSNIHKRRP